MKRFILGAAILLMASLALFSADTVAAQKSPGVQSTKILQEAPPAELIEFIAVRNTHLWDLAKQIYGDGSRWKEIFDQNYLRGTLDSADIEVRGPGDVIVWLEEGQNLFLPDTVGTKSTSLIRFDDMISDQDTAPSDSGESAASNSGVASIQYFSPQEAVLIVVLVFLATLLGLMFALFVYRNKWKRAMKLVSEREDERQKIERELSNELWEKRMHVEGPLLKRPEHIINYPQLPDGYNDPVTVGRPFAPIGIDVMQASIAARKTVREIFASQHNGERPDYGRTAVKNMRRVLFSGCGIVHGSDSAVKEMKLLREPGWQFDGAVIDSNGEITELKGIGTLERCANPFHGRREYLEGYEVEMYNERLVHVPFEKVSLGRTPGDILKANRVLFESDAPIRVHVGDQVIELEANAICVSDDSEHMVNDRFIYDPVHGPSVVRHRFGVINMTLLTPADTLLESEFDENRVEDAVAPV